MTVPYGYYEPKVSAGVVAAVRQAFARSRTSPAQWKHRQHEGRIDPRSAWRLPLTSRTDVFRDRTAPGATKVNVHILVDGSGSMSSKDQVNMQGDRAERIETAMDITATLYDAFQRQPQVRFSVTMHNTSVTDYQVGNIALWPIVRLGKGRENIGWMERISGSGNGDGYAIKAIGQQLRRDHRKGEVDLLIVVSDGLPSWLADQAYRNNKHDGVALVYNVVEDLRRQHIHVMSIAIADNPNQAEMFGEEGVIPFTGDWAELAVGIATVLGKTLTAAAKERRR